MDGCKNYTVFIVNEREMAKWRFAIVPLRFLLRRQRKISNNRVKFDREVNVYILYTNHCSKKIKNHYVNMCAADGRFTVDISCGNVNGCVEI